MAKNKNRFKDHVRKKSLVSGASDSKSAESQEQVPINDFLISLKHLDREQGQSFVEWEREGLLAQAMEVIQGYCCRPLQEQSNTKKFTVYGEFPKESDFTHPKHVPEDANWARIHITGDTILAGHIVNNIFYLVFLDKGHRFYITHKKHT